MLQVKTLSWITFEGTMPGSTIDVKIMKIKTNNYKAMATPRAEKSSQYSHSYLKV